MVDEEASNNSKNNRTSSVLAREGTSESTVVLSSANILLSSSSTSTNELTNKTTENACCLSQCVNDQPNLFDNIISNYRGESSENTNLDDEKFDKIERPNDADTANNSCDFLMNTSLKILNTSVPEEPTNCLSALKDNLILPIDSAIDTSNKMGMC